MSTPKPLFTLAPLAGALALAWFFHPAELPHAAAAVPATSAAPSSASFDAARMLRLQRALDRFRRSQEPIDPMPGARPDPALAAVIEQLAENQIALERELSVQIVRP